MEPMEWPLKSSALGKVSWRFQSAFILGLVGFSSKIFLGKMLLLHAMIFVAHLACFGLKIKLGFPS